MSDDGWRARVRWVVVHPGRDAVLVARPDGVVSYRAIVASQQPPIDVPMSRSTAWWLRQVLVGLDELAAAA